VAIVGKELKTVQTTHEILQILDIFLLHKTLAKLLLANSNCKNVKELNCKQLSTRLFRRDSSDSEKLIQRILFATNKYLFKKLNKNSFNTNPIVENEVCYDKNNKK